MRETVEVRLTSLAADLIKAREQAKWGGSEIAVRVIAPNVLISRIVEARDEITSLRAQLEDARRGLKVALHALKDVDGPVIEYDGENGIFLAKERDCTCCDAEQTIRALIAGSTK